MVFSASPIREYFQSPICFKIPNPGRLRRQIPHPGKSIEDPALKAFPTFCFSEGKQCNVTEAQVDNFIHNRVNVFCHRKPRFNALVHRNTGTGARFSKVPIINGPGKLSPFTLKIEVSIVLLLT